MMKRFGDSTHIWGPGRCLLLERRYPCMLGISKNSYNVLFLRLVDGDHQLCWAYVFSTHQLIFGS